MSSASCAKEASIPSTLSLPQEVESDTASKGTYGQILKSSALVGGSSLLNIGIGMIRTKMMAVLLGPAGFGLFGLYGSISTLTQTLAGMGINSSGVRQIAEANGSNDARRIAQTTVVLRRISLLLGLVGAVILVLFSRQISNVTFGTYQNATAISVLSIGVFFSLVSAGQGTLIQGMRRIVDLAKMGVLGAFLATIISITMVYYLREKGIVPALVAIAVMTTLVSWWYSRRIKIQVPAIAVSDVLRESSALLKLGFAFMISGLLTMGVAYAIRITILRKFGVEATGLYQSAWTLGGLYVGFILQAMGADFYPRLTTSIHDHATCNRLVNEQAQVGLLIAGPGVIATLTVAPLIISLFYSSKFIGAVEILRWICLGAILQVVTWPMGFIIVAKAKQALLIACELSWSVFSLGLAWICMNHFGLKGAGIAFFGSYVFHGFMIYAVVLRLSGFRWSAESKRTGIIYAVLIAIVFSEFYVLPLLWASVLGILIAVTSGVYSLRVLLHLVPLYRIPRPIRKVLELLRMAPSAS
ncbi:O-antigen translocase [Acidicapsa ligni]|uniref:O-antigen translocase n=1 Tax=Acidicapsa ligni TaxID=542300 RepID=UPI0021E00948|nr:O-antigen translocase [Acidicapsa ligni]